MESNKMYLPLAASSAALMAGAAMYYSISGRGQPTSEETPKPEDKKESTEEDKLKNAGEFKINWTNLRDLAEKYDIFLFDCDGVVWHGDKEHIGQAFRNIEWLESIGKTVFFVTNSAAVSRKSMVEKMATDVFKYKNGKIDHMYPSCAVAAQWVVQNLPECKKVRYIGMETMGEEIRSNGLETIGGSMDPEFTDPNKPIAYEDVRSYNFDPEVGAVITGIDFRLSYAKIILASCYIQKGAKWIVTNEDEYTNQGGLRAPGNGCIVAAI